MGYSYAGTYRPRPAYRFTVENSVLCATALSAAASARRCSSNGRWVDTVLMQRAPAPPL